jgi:hypothetical protein
MVADRIDGSIGVTRERRLLFTGRVVANAGALLETDVGIATGQKLHACLP